MDGHIPEDPFVVPAVQLPEESQEARDLCVNVWEKNFWELCLALIARFFLGIYRYNDHRRAITQYIESFPWAKEIRTFEQNVKYSLQNVIAAGQNILQAYRLSRVIRNLEILDFPVYRMELDMIFRWDWFIHQRRFDILRETRILSSIRLTNAQLQLLRTPGTRNTYKGYDLGEDLSEASENAHAARTMEWSFMFTDRDYASILKRLHGTIRDVDAFFATKTLRQNPILHDLSYIPTIQADGQWRFDRGNTPHGLTKKQWIKAFNRADSSYGTQSSIEVRKAARENGETRREAIRDLKAKGKLLADYVDSNW